MILKRKSREKRNKIPDFISYCSYEKCGKPFRRPPGVLKLYCSNICRRLDRMKTKEQDVPNFKDIKDDAEILKDKLLKKVKRIKLNTEEIPYEPG